MTKNTTLLYAISILILFATNAFTQVANNIQQGNIKITNTAAINTEALEFSPSYYQNGIVFATAKRKSGPRDGNIDETFFELSFAEFDGNGMPTDSEEFSVEMNSRVHEGPVTFTRDGKTIFLTRNNMKQGITRSDSNGKIRLKVYEATKGFFDWENLKELPFNSDEYDVMHPSLAPDGKTLYFASNMPGSMGGTDIWMATRDGDNWSVPVNLGPEVNSDKNDAFPFIHESGTLFYASQGLGGSGGYDIFKVNNAGMGGKSSNLGAPFNSNADDFGLIMNTSGTSGYFTSARSNGSGKDDIYKFDVAEGFISPALPDINALVRVYDKNSLDRIEGAEVRVFERSPNGILSGGELYDVILMQNGSANGELVMKLVPKNANAMGEPTLITDANGERPYDMRPDREYVMFASKEGYLTNEVVYSTVGKSGDLIVEIPLDVKNCATLTGTTKDAKTGAILPNTNVRISSTCGAPEMNLMSDANGAFEYCLPAGCNYTLLGSRTNYTTGSASVNIPAGSIDDRSTIINLVPNEIFAGDPNPVRPVDPNLPTYGGNVLSTGSMIVLDKIYYDFNKSAIRKGAAQELDALVRIMNQYPSMEIELSSHTDSRGTTDYNEVLSKRRAESAKRYLVARGISSRRIVTMGKGESQPRNGCVNGVSCSETEHQYNRRTEVRVTRIDDAVRVQYEDKGPEKIDKMRGRNR